MVLIPAALTAPALHVAHVRLPHVAAEVLRLVTVEALMIQTGFVPKLASDHVARRIHRPMGSWGFRSVFGVFGFSMSWIRLRLFKLSEMYYERLGMDIRCLLILNAEAGRLHLESLDFQRDMIFPLLLHITYVAHTFLRMRCYTREHPNKQWEVTLGGPSQKGSGMGNSGGPLVLPKGTGDPGSGDLGSPGSSCWEINGDLPGTSRGAREL